MLFNGNTLVILANIYCLFFLFINLLQTQIVSNSCLMGNKFERVNFNGDLIFHHIELTQQKDNLQVFFTVYRSI